MQVVSMMIGVMMMTFGANRCLTIKTKNKMKKNLFMVAAVALMALVSCNKEEINNGVVDPQEPQTPSVTVEFTASLGEEETKTTLDFENKKTLWVETDEISINGQKFTIKEIQEDGKAIFVNDAELPADFGAPFNAIYPYGSDGKVPAAQKAVAGNFDPEAVIEIATSENYTLSFTNVTSLLKFQVPAACESVSVASDDVLAGDSDKVVTISGDFVAGKDYYVAVLPGTKKNFVVRIDGYLSKNAASVTINPSTIANMKTLPEPLRKVYVKNDLNLSDLSLYAWDAQNNALIGGWPGTKFPTSTETVNGNSYYVYDLKDVSAPVAGVIVNGKATMTGSTKELLQTSNITENLKGNKYYRLSIRENYYKEVDPYDLSTFGFRIYVYIQKGDEHVDPYLHIWDTSGIDNTNWNSQLKMTKSWVYPKTGGKQFYYYEPPTNAYSSMNFIVTLNNGTKQTGDIKGALKNDYYVCAWANSSSECGLYCNSINNNSINASNIIKNNPESCK